MLAALHDSFSAVLVYSVPCKNKSIYKPVIEIPKLKRQPASGRLAVSLSTNPKGFTGKGTLALDHHAVRLFKSEAGHDEIAHGGDNINFAGSPLRLYAEGAKAGTAALTLTLSGANVTGTAAASLTCEEQVNVVTPKLETEYKLVLLDRDLAQHQDSAETKIHADPTCITVSLTQTNKDHPYAKAGTLKCEPANVDIFLDEACLTSAPASFTCEQLTAAQPLKLYLKGKTAGKFKLLLELEDPEDALVRLDKNPAREEMGVVELLMKVHQHDAAALAAIEVDPDTDPFDKYFKNLKAQVLPDQKEMSDQDKIKTGRLLHAQNGGNFGRAKLVLKKLDASHLPAGVDAYQVVVNQTQSSGAVEIYDKEWGGAVQNPLQVKVGALKSADKQFWVEGKTIAEKWRDVRLDVGLDRAPGGLDKKSKRNGDWARFTIVSIQEVKVDYTQPPGKAAAWDSAGQKFYVNLKPDPDGRKITIGAQLSKALKDVTVHFMLAPDSGNFPVASGSRLKIPNWGIEVPKTWKWKDISADIKQQDRSSRKKLLHLCAKTDAKGYAKQELVLSRCGGDKFQPACYVDQDPHLAKYVHGHSDLEKKKPVRAAHTITVWRKFWYQVVKVDGMNPPAMNGAEGQYTRVKATMVACSKLQVTRASVNAMNPRAIYPRHMVILNGGNADALVVSDTNKDQFFSGYAAEADKPIKIPILVCDAQWDEGGSTAAQDLNARAADFPIRVTTDKLVLNPPLQGGDLLAAGAWTAADWDATVNAGAGDWTNVRTGNLTNGLLSIDPARASLRDIKVARPPVGATTAQTRIWLEGLSVQAADGPYLGEYSTATKKILAVYDPGEPVDFQNTIAHEIGHAFHQVTTARPAGIPAHPNQYNSKGSHCSTSTDKCLMYESGPIAGSLNRYCDVCHPYVLVQNMSEVA